MRSVTPMTTPALSRLSRRHLLSLMAVSAGGLLAACASPLAVPGSRPARSSPVELVLGHFVPTSHEFHAQLLGPWAEDVERRASGRLHVNIHPGAALGPAPAQYRNVADGAMDIAFGVQSYTPGRFPLTEAFALPFLWSSAEQATNVLQSVYQSSPALQAEYADTRLLALFTSGPAQVMTSRRAVHTLADLKGLKIRSPGAVHNRVIEALGGVPLSMSVSETYDALERGVVNGTIGPSSVLTSFNLVDVIRHAANAHFTVSAFFLAMNRSRWENLSPQDQQVLEESTGALLSRRAAMIGDSVDRQATEVGRSRGVAMYELEPEELERWKAATRYVSDQWVREREANGIAARAVYERLVELAQSSEARGG